MGAPVGNQNAKKTRPFEDALIRLIAQEDGKRIREAADKLLTMAAEGTPWAVQLLMEKLDGKAAQQVNVAGTVNHEHRAVSDTADFIREAIGLGPSKPLPESLPH